MHKYVSQKSMNLLCAILGQREQYWWSCIDWRTTHVKLCEGSLCC